ncbi:hypothetical protein Tco_0280788 [Tanacetum coccineum]
MSAMVKHTRDVGFALDPLTKLAQHVISKNDMLAILRYIKLAITFWRRSFKSSNVNPLFEEKDKDVEIKSSTFVTLTSPEENVSIQPGIDLNLPPILKVSSSNPTSPTLTGEKVCLWKTPMFFSLVRFVWKMMNRIAIRKKIICLLATYLHQKPKLLSRPQEVEEIKEKEDEVSSDVPIDTIVMPIRITFDNPIDFNDHFSKPKDFKKDLTISFNSTTNMYRIFTKRQKSKPNRTKPNTDLERARKTEAKGTKGLKTKLKRKLPDRLDKVCAFNEDKTKSKSTPGYVVGKGIENRTRKTKVLKVGPPVPT